MGIYIKGMKLPKDGVIVLKIDTNGNVCTTARNDYKKYNAIELPPHGRLIEADELRPNMYDSLTKQFYINQKQIEAAPTIVPAEEE